jgi:hypothetical protein
MATVIRTGGGGSGNEEAGEARVKCDARVLKILKMDPFRGANIIGAVVQHD